MIAVLLTICGLVLFEVVSSLDNAVINAQVLVTVRDHRVRRFFLSWGLLFAVVVVRGVLPSIIIYAANPGLGMMSAFSALFTQDETAKIAIEASAPFLLTAGGVFLALLFGHWLFAESKEFGLPHEAFCLRIGEVWFHAVAALSLLVLCTRFPLLSGKRYMLAALIGYTAFFITSAFKEHAEAAESNMVSGEAGIFGDIAKVIFLEVIDLTFSIDGVVGAFAFTTMVPLILVGNGIGAAVVRQLTVGNIDRITKYPYLKNGAMYAIGILSGVMISEGLGFEVPQWVSPIATTFCIGFHFWLSPREKNREESFTQ